MVNRIIAENAITTGVATKDYWDVPHSNQIEGFTTDFSVNAGSTVDFKINVNGGAGSDYKVEIFRLDDSMEDDQAAKVRALRARRDQAAVDAALEKVRRAARNGDNLVPPCLEAVKAYATHGELCNVMREVFGVHTPDSQLSGV